MQNIVSGAVAAQSPTINIDVVIPTMGRRHHLFDVIEQLRDLAASFAQVRMRVIVSFNPKTPAEQTIFIDQLPAESTNFVLTSIRPERYQRNSEEHLLWLMSWYRAQASHANTYVWPLTDYDPIVPAGFAALVEYLAQAQPDFFYMNNLWGDTFGELLPSLSVRANVKVWEGPGTDFSLAIGFAHATTCIGTLFVRSGYLDDTAIQSFRDIFERSEVNAHAWWGFEMASRGRFAFLTTPIVINKFNRHNFDHAVTWKEATAVKQQASKWPWIVGYLRHLELYLERGMLTPRQLRTAVISEAQRGVLLFMDEIVRQLDVQMKLALRNPSERLVASDLVLIRKIFKQVFPLRMTLIDAMCDVLDAQQTDPTRRLVAYKTAMKFRYTEADQGGFSPLFYGSAYGYVIYEHRLGFAACLRKLELWKLYRDLDPFDISPLLLLAASETEIRAKIETAVGQADAEMLANEFAYPTVYLREVFDFSTTLPNFQLFLLSLSPRLNFWPLLVISKLKRLIFLFRRGFGLG